MAVSSGATNTIAWTSPNSGYELPGRPLVADSVAGDVYVTGAGQDVAVLSASANSEIASFPVGAPSGFGVDGIYDPQNGCLFFSTPGYANHDEGNVSIVSGTSLRVVTALSTDGYAPASETYAASNGEVYVTERPYTPAEGLTPGLLAISSENNSVVGRIPLGGDPGAILYDPVNGDLYVSDTMTNNLAAVSTATNAVVARFPDAGTLLYIAPGGDIYTERNGTDITVIAPDTNEVLATVGVGILPYATSYAASGYFYTTSYLDGSYWLDALDATTGHLVASLRIGPNDPFTPIYDPRNGAVYLP